MRLGAAVAAASLALAGCGSDPQPRSGVPTLPAECTRALPARAVPYPAEFPRPGGTIYAEPVEGSSELRQVRGFITRKPGVAVEDLIQRLPDAKVILREDDGFDAEVTLGDGRHRTFFKFTEVCSAGSRFTAQRVPEP